MNRYVVTAFAGVCIAITVCAENHIVIAKDTKVFEAPVAKDECAALNKNDDPVILKTGMVFAVIERKGGWYVVEYSPGLRGMVMQNVIAMEDAIKVPSAGTFKVANNPDESVVINRDGDKWLLESSAKKYEGRENDRTVIFTTTDGVAAYSVSNLSGKQVVYSLDNSVTGFF